MGDCHQQLGQTFRCHHHTIAPVTISVDVACSSFVLRLLCGREIQIGVKLVQCSALGDPPTVTLRRGRFRFLGSWVQEPDSRALGCLKAASDRCFKLSGSLRHLQKAGDYLMPPVHVHPQTHHPQTGRTKVQSPLSRATPMNTQKRFKRRPGQ